MEIRIEQVEIAMIKFMRFNEQDVLSMLKDKGAPVEGTIFFKLKEGYEISREDCKLTGDLIFKFKEIKINDQN